VRFDTAMERESCETRCCGARSRPGFGSVSRTAHLPLGIRALACVGILAGCLLSPSGCVGPLKQGIPPLKLPGFNSQVRDDQQERERLAAPDARESAAACFRAAEALAAKHHDREAIRLFEKCRKLDPDTEGVAHRLAVLYDRNGQSARALQEYQQALDEKPESAQLHNDLGYYYYQRGDLPTAERHLQQAVRLDSELEQAWINLGLTRAQLGRWEESYRAFEKGVGPAAAHSNVGILLAKAGHPNEARQHLEQSLALDATLAQPRAFLARLAAGPQR